MLVAPLSVFDYEREGLLKNGKPRLACAQSYFLGLRNGDLDGLENYYETWRDFNEYLVLMNEDMEAIAVKCSKRGNDVYRKRTSARFNAFESFKNERFFQDDDIEKGIAFTKALFFTLTYDTKLCSLPEAWHNVGIEFNGWISRIRDKYGKVSVIRTWQDFNNGYPHVHGVLMFHDARFQVVRKDVTPVLHGHSSAVYRIAGFDDFKQSWHSFVDVSACYSVAGAVNYARRYITRGVVKGEEYRAPMQEGGHLSSQCQALNWLFHKRSFSVSGDFRSQLAEFITALRNSKALIGQRNLEGDVIREKWTCLGIHSPQELQIDGSRWFYRIDSSLIEEGWFSDSRGVEN
jgi:hypothetical protein